MLNDKIRECATIDRTDPYDDEAERQALRTFLKDCPEFQQYWANYFGLIPHTKIEDDPLGLCKVDLGLMCQTYYKIYGLIEVDIFHSWEFGFPANYKYFHVLERKLKYFLPSDYNSETLRQGKPGKPYITCTFNRYHNQMCSTTKENIVRCLHKYGVQEIYMPKIDAYDRVIRCPLDENIHWFGVRG